jgi:hypothetical protein
MVFCPRCQLIVMTHWKRTVPRHCILLAGIAILSG